MLGGPSRTEVRYRRGHDNHVRTFGLIMHCMLQLHGGFHRDDLDTWRIGQRGIIRSYKRYRGAPLYRDFCKREALPPRRMVSDKTNRIDNFLGASSTNKHVHTGKVVLHRRTRKYSAKTACTRVFPSQAAHCGVEHHDSAFPQRRDIRLRRRIIPHFGMHSRRNNHRARSDQHGSSQ